MRNVFRKSPPRGFTLLELLMLLLVLGSLLSLAYPHVRSMLDQAAAEQCKSNLEQIRRAKSAYVVDHLGVAPDGVIPGERSEFVDATRVDDTVDNLGVFRAYFPERTVLSCPRVPNGTADAGKDYVNRYDLFRDATCPYCPTHP